MYRKTKPNFLYNATQRAYNSNEDMENSNGATDDTLKWEEDGVVTNLMDMASTTNYGEHHDVNHVQQEGLRYYVPRPLNQVTIPYAQTQVTTP
jgi:hypothetical protein